MLRTARSILVLAVVGVALSSAHAPADSFDWGDYEDQPDDWFRGAEAARMTGNILTWQSNAGDWPKNTNTSKEPFTGDRNKLAGTFDNGATTGELRFLARMYRATDAPRDRSAVLKGIDHILAAQYPSGGWPQFRHRPTTSTTVTSPSTTRPCFT